VRDLDLRLPVTARPGDSCADARERALADPFPYLLIVDPDDRPIGWLDDRRIPREGRLSADLAEPMSPLVSPETTLKDALSLMLDADVQTGIAVDRHGRLIGLVTVDAIATQLRPSAAPEVLAPALADA
jgi:osmoprotectant transport system ATP-binding protein